MMARPDTLNDHLREHCPGAWDRAVERGAPRLRLQPLEEREMERLQRLVDSASRFWLGSEVSR